MESKTLTLKEREKKNAINLAIWTLGWTLSIALVTFGPESLWNFNQTFTVLALFINVVLGIAMIFANIRHLKGLDELHQKIQLEAMAIALGVTLVVGMTYEMMAQAHVWVSKASISHVVMVMALVYMAATVIGNLRYK